MSPEDQLNFAALDVQAGLRALRQGAAGALESLRVRWLLLDAAQKQAVIALFVTGVVTLLDVLKARALGGREGA